ncbi:SDR family NAD(P)-dependent oxidoreductase [Paraburkholderia oxyphila]|uniref:SDR family NAD(P)-dependent oxidoreductase n=1 Tax=Paraburkholderia oxyphila TaxID=614212 RepID=UPI0005B92B00|nr:SDR family NAD(P)-dependent oxidoreductase [Paraburkholderia oxyphila]
MNNVPGQTHSGEGVLAQRVALVTGVGPGLGRACAVALAQAGASVAVCDVDPETLEATRAAVEAEGVPCLALRCDVSSSADVQRMFSQVAVRFGTLHILVNNAALTPNRPDDTRRRNLHYGYMTSPVPRQSLGFTSSMSDEDWHHYWGVNVHGVFYCAREALKLMEPQRYGRIVNVASIAGISAMSAHSPHYSATKGAVIAFSKALAAEVAGANVFVNVLAPGGVATPEFNAYLDTIGDEARNRLWQMVPSGRLGTPEEYAATVVHLASDHHYLVGQVISPNGGAVI